MSLMSFTNSCHCTYHLPVSFRHREVSRLEGFSDAVFGFALTLLVVSLETPKSFDDLKIQMGGFVPFALMFAMVCWIWYEHNLFFRRYGLQDALTVFLNAVLLFVVLFYVYPLRFLTMGLVGRLTLPASAVPDMRYADGALLMTLYSSGVLAIFTVFVLLHQHAWRQRRAMDLDAVEELQLRYRMRSHMISAGLAVASLVIVFLVPGQVMWAGLIYCLMGPLHAWNGHAAGSAQAKLRKASLAPAE
jgi:uncharacterized membrane protein